MDFPIYQAFINEDLTDDSGIFLVSFVDEPAIKKDFQFYSQPAKYSSDDEKRIVSGPVILVDVPIYRNENGFEFYSVFTAENTAKIVKKMAMQSVFNDVNTQHKTMQDGVFMLESYFIDRERGINPPKGFEDAKDGSYFRSYYVANDEVWQGVKDGTFKGFSIEGRLNYENMGEIAQTLAALRELSAEIEKNLQ